MPLIVDPYKSNDFEYDGVVFQLRALLSREKVTLIPYLQGKILDPEALARMVEMCLLGWNDKIKFDKDDNKVNVDKLDMGSLTNIAEEILRLSELDTEQVENLQ